MTVRAVRILSLLAICFALNACDNSVSPLFREPEALSLTEDKETRRDWGCTAHVVSSVVDGEIIDQTDEFGELDESIEILPVVDADETIVILVKKFGKKATGHSITAPEFVTMQEAGSDEDGNPKLSFSSDESFIFVGAVTDKRGNVSQCAIGVTVIPEPEEDEDEDEGGEL